jgi:maltose alpha-D-glucosyltransferase / alpha-amylase
VATHPSGGPQAPSLWYRDAVIYEVHVRAFRDSDANGAGDFAGLIEKLDYIQALGVTAIWLLPFFPSPWLDDGYDISDFTSIHPAFGDLEDFRRLLAECKRRDLRVITELVLNHTSDQHPWFQRARHAPAGSALRNFYVWSDTPERYAGVRIIFKDFEASNWTWDPVAKAYYWHRFYSHQPDLNYDNPAVRDAVLEAVDFWLELGVDGLRLDAVPYLFEREGTTCENLAETHQFLRELRRHVDAHHPNRMLLAEANQWPEHAVAYFAGGDECHMAFHFPLMPRLFMATRMEDSFPIINIVQETPAIPDNCQWATFLRNHDELTLEMVCEEERGYMYRMYASDAEMRINVGIRRRLAPLLENDRRRIELMNSLLFSLPGTPVIYYGDEIGMGEHLGLGDRNGVRTPMQWNAGTNAGFSESDPEKLYLPLISSGECDYEFVNVEAQERNRNSLLWWMRRALVIRKECPALTRGATEFLQPENRHVLAFLRKFDDETVLIAANLSRFAQPLQVDLSQYSGYVPIELFGRVEFPAVDNRPYQLSLSPYASLWLRLRPGKTALTPDDRARTPIRVSSLDEVFDWSNRQLLAHLIFPGIERANEQQARRVTHVEVIDAAIMDRNSCLCVLRVWFAGGDPDIVLTPVAIAPWGESEQPFAPAQPIGVLEDKSGNTAALYSHVITPECGNALLQLIANRHTLDTHAGELTGSAAGPFVMGVIDENICLAAETSPQPRGDNSVRLGDLFMLKILRKLEAGPHPDVELVRYLFEEAGFGYVAPAVGTIEYRQDQETPMIAAVLHSYVNHRDTMWGLTLDELAIYFERVATGKHKLPEGMDHDLASELIQTYLAHVALLAERTAQLHLALSRGNGRSDFEPEPVDAFYVRGETHAMTTMLRRLLDLLNRKRHSFSGTSQDDAAVIVRHAEVIRGIFESMIAVEQQGLRTRIHGDLHLARVLYTGEDLVFIGFGGDSSHPLGQRMIKRLPLIDVAGMLYSLRFAATRAGSSTDPSVASQRGESQYGWGQFWYRHVRAEFIRKYRELVGTAPLGPASLVDFETLLNTYLFAKAVSQVDYDWENQPEATLLSLGALADLVREHHREG